MDPKTLRVLRSGKAYAMTRKTLASLGAEIESLNAELRITYALADKLTRERDIAREWAVDKKDLSNRLLNVIESCAREGNMKI